MIKTLVFKYENVKLNITILLYILYVIKLIRCVFIIGLFLKQNLCNESSCVSQKQAQLKGIGECYRLKEIPMPGGLGNKVRFLVGCDSVMPFNCAPFRGKQPAGRSGKSSHCG